MIYVVIWLLCGVIAAAVYSSKGRSGAAAFVVGVLLGPIGVILALLSSTDTASVERKAVTSGEMKKCPFCAELIKADATVCRYCHKDMPAAVPGAPVRPYIKRVKDSYYCSSCNQGTRPDAERCKHCGASFKLTA